MLSNLYLIEIEFDERALIPRRRVQCQVYRHRVRVYAYEHESTHIHTPETFTRPDPCNTDPYKLSFRAHAIERGVP
jgi:hypothetical protein